MLGDIVRKLGVDLVEREGARDEAYGRARRVRMLSKRAILLLHRGESAQAEGNLGEAGMLLVEVSEYLERFPELASYDAVRAAWEEYSEASILFRLGEGDGFPSPMDLGVPASSYVLGLADVPGELRRQALDLLRAGDLDAAEVRLSVMEEVYLHLSGVEETSLLLKGLRRKMDVMRGVIERTRSEVTMEASRERLRRLLSGDA